MRKAQTSGNQILWTWVLELGCEPDLLIIGSRVLQCLMPDSLRWRVVGWMEMGLSQADAARLLNVSRSVVHRLWNQYQAEASVSRRHVSGRPRATTPSGNCFITLLT
ncbi:paired domain-containing protein [Trichonephila clavipes]|nr:paired domain-containing protein [Trichonephila clavipes]